MAQKQAHKKVDTISIDTSVLISHLKGDRFADETDSFLQSALEERRQLIMSDVVYAELYTGIFLAEDPRSDEARVQNLLKVNGIEVRTSKSLKVARRAGELYSMVLKGSASTGRILPDMLIAAQAEFTSKEFVTWNEADYKDLELRIPVLSPSKF